MSEEQVKTGDKVQVHYKGWLNDGTVFDSSENREPLEFTVGAGQVIPGFESGVMGMKEGESKTINIPAQNAYGDRNEEMVLTVDRGMFPADIKPEIGQRLQLRQRNGEAVVVTVTKVTKDQVVLDANHPLAGKDLTFDLKLVKIAA